MDLLSIWQSALVDSWSRVWSSFFNLLPQILGAIIVFAIGLLLAFWLKRLATEFLRLIKFERFSKSTGADRYLKKADIKFTLEELIASIVEWLIILVFFLAAVDILGLSAVSLVLAQVLGYVPNVLAAALILTAGIVIGRFADGLVRGALTSIDTDIAKPIGKLARWTIVIVSFFAAVEQLKIAQGLISTLYQGLTYTIVIAVGLSIGLGAKDVVAKVLDDWYVKIKK